MAQQPNYEETLQILREAANKSDLITNKYHDVLVYDENSDIDLGDGEFTPSLSKRVKQFVTANGSKRNVTNPTAVATTINKGFSGTLYTNLALSTASTFTLPKAEIGLHFSFFVVRNTLAITVRPNAADTIVGFTAGTGITNAEVGSRITVTAISDTQWVISDDKGAWIAETT